MFWFMPMMAVAGAEHSAAVELLTRLFYQQNGALSVQVLAEFYVIATKKLGIKSDQAEQIIAELGSWTIHRPGYADLIQAAQPHRRHKLG